MFDDLDLELQRWENEGGAASAPYDEAAKAGCPVSQALAGVEITLEAKLAEK